MPGTTYNDYDEDARYEVSWVRTNMQSQLGLWGCWDNLRGCYVGYGSKDEIGQLAQLLNLGEIELV